MRTRRILILSLAAQSLLACGEAADTLPGQPIAHRRAAFKKLLLAFEPLGIQLRDKQLQLGWELVQGYGTDQGGHRRARKD